MPPGTNGKFIFIDFILKFEEVSMLESNICTERFYFLLKNVCLSMYFYGMDKLDAANEAVHQGYFYSYI